MKFVDIIRYLIFVILIASLIRFFRHYLSTSGIIMSGKNISLDDLQSTVTDICLLHSKLERLKYVPGCFTKNLSHWSTLVKTNTDRFVIVSPHENKVIRVIFLDDPKIITRNKRKYIVLPRKKYNIDSVYKPDRLITLKEYIETMKQFLYNNNFNLLDYNCQAIVVDTMKKYVPNFEMKLYQKSKLLQICAKEMTDKRQRLES